MSHTEFLIFGGVPVLAECNKAVAVYGALMGCRAYADYVPDDGLIGESDVREAIDAIDAELLDDNIADLHDIAGVLRSMRETLAEFLRDLEASRIA